MRRISPGRPLEERFFSHVNKGPECWIWTASFSKGFGQMNVGNNQMMMAHKISWKIKFGDVPYGQVVIQGCGNKSCVNPEHLGLAINKRTASFEERFWARVNKSGPIQTHCPEIGQCWEWAGALVGKYGITSVGGTKTLCHRASWELHNGKITDRNMKVLHKCDNPPCVRPSHLFLGTSRDNIMDCISKGRNNPKIKLSADQVIEIKNRFYKGASRGVDIAKEFGVSKGVISMIVNGSRRKGSGIVDGKWISQQGERSSSHKLNNEKIKSIRLIYKSGARQCDIASQFGVSQSAVSRIVIRQTWDNV